jgi:hypothetical protein
MAQPLKRLCPKQEEALFKAYQLLSDVNFKIQIEEGYMTVWLKYSNISNDLEEGFVIVPEEYQDEFNQRQEELEEEDVLN